MRGHIVKRYKGSYTIVLPLGTDPQGKRKQQWVSVKGTKKDAEKRLSELLHQLDTGTFMKPGKTTLAEYLARWLQDYAKPKLSPRSFDRYADIVARHLNPQLGNILLTQLKPGQLQRLYSGWLDKGLSNRTVRYHHAVLHCALKSAVKWGLVGHNVAEAVELPKISRKDMQTWDENEVNRFLETTKDTAYHVLFYTFLLTGMRRSEELALSWQNVDLVSGQISVTRGLHQLRDGRYIFSQPKSAKSRRTIALPPSLTLLLQQHKAKQTFERKLLGVTLQETDLVFGNLDKPLRPNTVSRAWKNIARRAGVKVIRLHDARHTHASLMLKQGIHPKIVQERLGHSSITMTLDTYSHVAPGLQEAAAARFDEILNSRRENEAVVKVG